MNEWFWAAAALLVVNLIQAAYWTRQVQRLIDKLMSRSYAEYTQTKALADGLSREDPDRKVQDLAALAEEDAILTELNKTFGF